MSLEEGETVCFLLVDTGSILSCVCCVKTSVSWVVASGLFCELVCAYKLCILFVYWGGGGEENWKRIITKDEARHLRWLASVQLSPRSVPPGQAPPPPGNYRCSAESLIRSGFQIQGTSGKENSLAGPEGVSEQIYLIFIQKLYPEYKEWLATHTGKQGSFSA